MDPVKDCEDVGVHYMFGDGSSGVYETIYWSKAAGSRAKPFGLEPDS